MMRSMFAGISGLRAHQTMMDVVGNNIANVSTAGFKASQITFQEALTQTLQGAGQGTNPMQLGLGTRVSGITGIFTQGATQVTGRSTDLAIQGEGFFIIQNGTERLYSRAGSFNFDGKGRLASNGGGQVMGWMADAGGNIDYARPMGQITMPIGQVIEPVKTSEVEVGGNLSAEAAVGDKVATSIVVYDSLGNSHEVRMTFEKTADNAWSAKASIGGTDYTLTPAAASFGADGKLTSAGTLAFSGFTPPGADPMTFDVKLDGGNPLVQFGGASTAEALKQDGVEIGTLRNFSIGQDGSITGQFSNGQTKVLGAIATATFANPAGLMRAGDSMFSASVNSGDPIVGAPGVGNRGSLVAGAVEMSNVDLAQEFTNLIIAQRGFQANSRVITSSDEILTDLVNLKR